MKRENGQVKGEQLCLKRAESPAKMNWILPISIYTTLNNLVKMFS
jgi:hypothetical protein